MEDIWNIFSKTEPVVSTRKSSIEVRTCQECKSIDTMLHEGHTICMNCGTDMGPILEGDDTSIFHDSSKSGNTHRLCTNTNALLQKSSLGTTIGPGSYRFRSLMRYHKYNSMPYKERSQWKIYKIIRTACEKINLPRIIIEES
jgi:transcription initiation factor TFIIIB Brf1 subunit/transcription initiation factor TFIIB